MNTTQMQQLAQQNPREAYRLVASMLMSEESKLDKAMSPQDVIPWLRAATCGEEERFSAVFLDHANRIVGRVVYDNGSKTRAILFPRKLFTDALLCGATGMILCHNHPSGNREPSLQDQHLTQRIRDLGESLEVALRDHIIITYDSHYSFALAGGWL